MTLSIKEQPQSKTVKPDESAEFAVVAEGGASPYAFQWKKNGASIAGATKGSYKIESVQKVEHEGGYVVEVRDSSGATVLSNEAGLQVEAQKPKAGSPLRAWFSSLSKSVQWLVKAVVAAGAVAAAIAAIIGLWPDPQPPTPELGAELSEVTIDQNVTLDQYAIRSGEPQGASAPNSAAKPQLAAVILAQTEIEDTTGTVPTQTDTNATDTTQTGTETETPETETTEIDDGDVGLFIEPKLSREALASLRKGVRRALEDPAIEALDPDLGPCAARPHGSECALKPIFIRPVSEDGSSAEVSETEVAKRLVEVLKATRMKRLASGRRQPVGVTVNYRISLAGFRGGIVDVHWALYRPSGPLPHPWLKDQRAARLQGEAERDSASPSFWVPLPKLDGPFFVRLTVRNENGVPLDRADSPRFG